MSFTLPVSLASTSIRIFDGLFDLRIQEVEERSSRNAEAQNIHGLLQRRDIVSRGCSTLATSCLSYPTMAFSSMAASSAVLVIGPQ